MISSVASLVLGIHLKNSYYCDSLFEWAKCNSASRWLLLLVAVGPACHGHGRFAARCRVAFSTAEPAHAALRCPCSFTTSTPFVTISLTILIKGLGAVEHTASR